MSNSGSYVSTVTRTSLTIPLQAEESVTYDAIKDMVRKKKIQEASALRTAKLRQEQRNDNDLGGGEWSEQRARDAAIAKMTGLKNQLNKLFLQQAELEKSVQYKWKEKVNEFEQRSLREEQEELNRLRQEQKQLLEKVRMEHENAGDKRLSVPSSETKKGKRKAESDEAEEPRNKRRRVAESATGKGGGGGDRGGRSDAKASQEKGVSVGEELVGDDDNEEGEEKVLESAKKDKELEVCSYFLPVLCDVILQCYGNLQHSHYCFPFRLKQ